MVVEYLVLRALKHAAEVIQSCPMALQLRYLQTLSSIASESKVLHHPQPLPLSPDNSTIVFPVPIDIISTLLPMLGRAVGRSPTHLSLPSLNLLENM